MAAYDICCLINIFFVWVAIVYSKMNFTSFEFEFDNTIGKQASETKIVQVQEAVHFIFYGN